ncbi:MAG: purine-nucleoside phosphorylase [Bacteroidia bacterium]|jgi:purine-nucleoside phosphorylase|nr:purine-nucleoside phosphorylase [Bacteroidia bacterium]
MTTNLLLKQIQESADFLNNQGFESPDVGIVLGTGLGQLVSHIQVIHRISYHDIPHFPVSTVESHSGKLIYGMLEGKKVIAMQGRFHYYEGYAMHQIVHPIRVMKMLGIQYLFISNAAGCLNLSWKKGDLMLLDDHINLLPDNPLRGNNIDELGTRFPDLSAPYHPKLNHLLIDAANLYNIKLHQGIYVSVTGPMLETRAEYRYLRMIGADAVGMSTVPEVIAANHLSLPCCAVSVLTDECDPDNLKPVSLEMIIEVATKAEIALSKLMCYAIKNC